MEEQAAARLRVTAGPEQGREFLVVPEGVRLGRSSRNDVALSDPLLSRHHCRIFIKPDGKLWVADLGSANHTFVNGQEVQEAALRSGDTIAIGDTRLEVQMGGAAEPPAVVDLGLPSGRRAEAAPAPRRRMKLLVAVAAGMVVLAVAVWVYRLNHRPAPPPSAAAAQPRDQALTISYEKVQAAAENIFRYNLELHDGKLVIEIDDLGNNRHVRKESQVDPDLLRNLTRTLRGSGIFALDEEYLGVQPGILDESDICVTIDRETHRTRVLNRIEPEPFKSVRQTLEAFGKNELGLWAIPFSADELVKKSEAAYALGRKLREERQVKDSNLADAIRSFREAEWYLETVEVKPGFYMELRNQIAECEELLDTKYNDQNFLAERAIRLRDWQQAARELQVLLEVIPDRSDTRNQEARKKLLDVEARLAAQK
jgi:hypothetical protein